METQLFDEGTKIPARALFVGQRIDLRALETTRKVGVSPLMISAGEHGYVVLFRYGAVVLFNVTAIEEAAFLRFLSPFVSEPLPNAEHEDAELIIDTQRAERVDDGEIVLHQASVARLQLVADILAKSTVLGYYETTVAQAFDRVEPLAVELERRGKGGHASKELLRHIGSVLLTQTKMVGRVEIQEKPEILWERPDLELLYIRVQDEYELTERHLALDRKLDVINNTVESLLDLLHHGRSLRVEWYIVILILVEICLTLYEMITGT